MFNLPYFDELIAKLERGDPIAQQMWGSNVHFGYWDRPDMATNTVTDFIAASRRMNEIFFQKLKIQDGMSILDAGCGFGGTLLQLAERYKDLNLFGINIDPRQVKRAKSQMPAHIFPNISFIQADACQIPLKSRSFDCVVAVECIFHFSSRTRFLHEVKRILKPGGKLVISDFVYNRPTLSSLYSWLSRQSIFTKWGQVTPVSEKGYQKLFKRLGFIDFVMSDITQHVLPNYDFLFPRQSKNTPLPKERGLPLLHERRLDSIFQMIVEQNLVKYTIVEGNLPNQ